MALTPGARLGVYEIVAQIGVGGMGAVYRATDTSLSRQVAIKVLPDAFAQDAERLARFGREAKTLASLNHPKIAAIYGFEKSGGIHALVMELVEGDDLSQRIARGAIPIDEALPIAKQIADALEAAHEQGIIHRDLKPANIKVRADGTVKVLDFGLAKAMEPTGAMSPGLSMSPTLSLQATQAGMILGTAGYMSPEQARGKTVDKRSDIWAFGAVLFEMLTGQRAFGGDDVSEVLSRVLQREPAWAALPPEVPLRVQQVLRMCLQKDLKQRAHDIADIRLALEGAFETAGGQTAAPVAVPQWRRVAVVTALVGAAVLGAALGWLVSWQVRVTAPVVARPVVRRLSTPFVAIDRPGEWHQPAIAVALDGGSIVYVGKSAGSEPQLYLRRLDRLDGVPLPGTEGASGPFFSADGKSVGFFAGERLKKLSIGDGVVQALCDAPTPFGGAWGDDNVIVFGSLGVGVFGGLMRVSAYGGTPERLTELGPGEAAHRWPALLPGSRVVLYTATGSTGPGLEEPHIVAQSLDSGKREILPVDATYARFAPGGRHLLLVRRGTVVAVPFDPVQLKISGSQVPVIDGVMQASTGAAQLGASDSVLAYLQGAPETRRLLWVDRQGRAEPLDAPPRLYVHPRLSPDGQEIAVAITEPKNDIWIYDIARSTLSRLTIEGSNAYPIWTRDGKRVTYVSSQQGHPPNLFWKSADGTGPEERLITSKNTQVTETWAPDGKTLLFVELRPPPTGWDILTLSLAEPRQVVEFLKTPFLDGTPQISPTGRYVAYVSTESGTPEIVVRSFPGPGAKLQVSSGGAGQPAWRVDERELFYRGGQGYGQEMMAASVTTAPRLSIGKPTVLFRGQFANIQGKNYDVTPDGQRFLMVRSEEPVPPREITVVIDWMEDLKARLLSQ